MIKVRLYFEVEIISFIGADDYCYFNYYVLPEAMCDLTICKLSDCNSPVSGGKEIIMLCDKVAKSIQI